MNMLRQLILLCSLLLLTCQGQAGGKKAIKNDTKKTVNICYESLSQAYSSLDPQQMADVYTANGIYISTGGSMPLIHGQASLYKLYDKYFSRLKKHNSSLDLQFRVTSRLVDTKTVHDVGYYVVTVIPPQESKQPPKQHAGKFMITFSQKLDGNWGVWSEANSKSKVKNYMRAKEIDGLHYDPYYPIETYLVNH
jgi:hypothetical protein